MRTPVHYYLLLCCLLWNGIAYAQIKISGRVTGRRGAPVPTASVLLKGAGSGAATDSLGYYSFTATVKGRQALLVSSVGYQPKEVAFTAGDSSVTLNVTLLPDNKTLGEVVVTAGAFEASDKAKGASLTPMDAVTVAGSNGDLANSLRSLPGAQQIGEKEGLFVRGGTGEETRQFIDGTWMRHPNFSAVPGLPQYARINPFLFKGILFSAGGYSAQYGQALSSALILESVDLPEQSSASLHLFPVSVGAGFQQLAKNKKSSYGLSVSYGNLALYNNVVPQKQSFFHHPEYLRGEANYRVKTSKTGMFKIYLNSSYTHTGMRNPDVDSSALLSAFRLQNRNVYTNISYREQLGSDWKINLGAAYSYNKDRYWTQLQNSLHAPVAIDRPPYSWKNRLSLQPSHFAQGRAVLTRSFAGRQALHLGAEYFYTDDRYTSNDSLYRLRDGLFAAFAEGDIRIAQNIMARAGLRFERSSLLRQSSVAPRVSLAWRFNDGGQLNLAYGIFYQKPENQYLYQQQSLRFAQATHYIVNYTRKAGNRMLRLEAYYKDYRRLLSTLPGMGNNGKGYARGIELFWRDKRSIRNLDYWVTYTYLDTKRQFLNYPYSLRPDFATPHTASVAVKRFFPDLNFNINMAYFFATGRPYYDIRPLPAAGKAQVFDNGTTRNYSSLNLSGAYMFTIFKKWKHKDFSGIGFGCNNVLGTPMVFGYQYSYDGRNRVPVTLPAARSFYIGIFTSFGIDRTQDFIEENLK